MGGHVERGPGRVKLVVVISAVVVLAATVGLAGYVRFVARGESEPGLPGRSAPAPGAPSRPDPVRLPSRARDEAGTPADATVEVRERPVAEDLFLGAPESPASPPSTAGPAPAPPDPPRAPTEPEPPAVDDPHDFDVQPAAELDETR